MFKATPTFLPLIMMLLPFHVHTKSKSGYVFSLRSIRLTMTTVKTKIKSYNLMDGSKKAPCLEPDIEHAVNFLLEADHQHFAQARQEAVKACGGYYHLVCMKIVEMRGAQGFNEFMQRAPCIWRGFSEDGAGDITPSPSADVPMNFDSSGYYEPPAFVWEKLEGSR